jgi:hypothetical protein
LPPDLPQTLQRRSGGDPQTGAELGAPLRNRTVDLLLTICSSLGSLAGKCRRQGRRHLPAWILPRPAVPVIAQVIAPTAEEHMGWVHTHRAVACPTAPTAAQIAARGTACRSVTPKPTVKRRSDDLPGPAHSGPKAASSRRIPDARQNLNQRPYLHIARKALTEARSLLGRRSHRGTCRGAESENLATRVRQHHRCILICRCECVLSRNLPLLSAECIVPQMPFLRALELGLGATE